MFNVHLGTFYFSFDTFEKIKNLNLSNDEEIIEIKKEEFANLFINNGIDKTINYLTYFNLKKNNTLRT